LAEREGLRFARKDGRGREAFQQARVPPQEDTGPLLRGVGAGLQETWIDKAPEKPGGSAGWLREECGEGGRLGFTSEG
jgi:hypothetical protein